MKAVSNFPCAFTSMVRSVRQWFDCIWLYWIVLCSWRSLQDYHSIRSRRICPRKWELPLALETDISNKGFKTSTSFSKSLYLHIVILLAAKHPEKLPKQFSFQIQIDTVPSQCQVIKTDTVPYWHLPPHNIPFTASRRCRTLPWEQLHAFNFIENWFYELSTNNAPLVFISYHHMSVNCPSFSSSKAASTPFFRKRRPRVLHHVTSLFTNLPSKEAWKHKKFFPAFHAFYQEILGVLAVVIVHTS